MRVPSTPAAGVRSRLIQDNVKLKMAQKKRELLFIKQQQVTQVTVEDSSLSEQSEQDEVVKECRDPLRLQRTGSGVYILSPTFGSASRVKVNVPGVKLGSSVNAMKDLVHVEE